MVTDPRFTEAEVHRREQRDVEFLACDRAGMSASQLSERFGVTARTVQRWRKRLGIKHRQYVEKHQDSDRNMAEYLLDEGCSFQETARTLGVSDMTIYRWFPDRKPWSKQECAEYAVLVRQMGRLAA